MNKQGHLDAAHAHYYLSDKDTQKKPIIMIKIKVLMANLGQSKQTVYNKIKKGLLTPPVHVGPNSSRWLLDEVEIIQAAYIAGKDDDSIRSIVRQLIKERPRRLLELQKNCITQE